MKKILNSFFLLFLLTILEYGSFYLGILKSFNSFLLILIWFRYLYRIYGFTELETKLRDKYPIKFKFNPLYLFKLFKRAIKIKFIIINLIITNVKNKRISIKDFSFLIFIIGITLVLFRYLRGCLLVEVIEVLNLDKKLAEILAIGGIIIGCVLELIYKSINPTLNYAVIGDQAYSNSAEESLSNLTSMMKRAGSQVKGKLGEVIRRGSGTAGKSEVVKIGNSELPSKITHEASKISYLLKKMGEYIHTPEKVIKYIPGNLYWIPKILEETDVYKKLEMIYEHAFDINQERKIYIFKKTAEESLIFEGPNSKLYQQWCDKRSIDPYRIDEAIEIIKAFHKDIEENILTHSYLKNYFHLFPSSEHNVENISYEFPSFPLIRAFLGKNVYALPAKKNIRRSGYYLYTRRRKI